MHILITGGAGFIGSHLAEAHLAKGDKVHVVDDLSTGSEDNLQGFRTHPGFRFDQADIIDWAKLPSAVQWADRIYHMAAVVGVKRVLEDPVRVVRVNMTATERLLAAIQSGGWQPEVVIASSSELYSQSAAATHAESDDLVFDADHRLRWTYAVTKLADEFLAFAYHQRYGLRVVVARLFNVIGPRQTGRYGMVVPTFVRQAAANEPITVFGEGGQTRSFADVRDVVEILDRLASRGTAWGEVVNVGNDEEITILDLAKLIKSRANSRSNIVHVSYTEAYGNGFQDVPHRRPNLAKQARLSGYKPLWTLTHTIDDLIGLNGDPVFAPTAAEP